MSRPSQRPSVKSIAIPLLMELVVLRVLPSGASAGCEQPPSVHLLRALPPGLSHYRLAAAAAALTSPVLILALVVLTAIVLATVAYSVGYRRTSGRQPRLVRALAHRLRIGERGVLVAGGLPRDEPESTPKEELRESEQRIELALDAAQMGIWERDLVTDRLRWSPRVEVILGLAPGSFDGKATSFEQRIHPEDRERVAAQWQAVYADPECDHYTATYRILRAEGQVRWVQSHTRVARDGQKRAVALTGVLQDVTEQRETAERIEWLSRFTEENTSPVLRVTRDGTLLYANTGSRPFITAGRVTGVGEPVSAAWRNWVESAFQQGATQHFDERVEGHVYGLTVAPNLDADYASIQGSDVTDRVRAEEAARRYTQRLEVLRAIDKGLLAARSAVDISQAALSYLGKLWPLKFGTVALFRPETQQVLLVAAQSEVGGEWPTDIWLSAEGLSPLVGQLAEGRPLVVDDFWAIDSAPERIRALREGGIRAYLLAPLMVQGQMLGCLVLGASERSDFPDEATTIVSEVADQLPIALHNAQHSEQIERRAQELELRVAERTSELQRVNSEMEAFSYSVSHDLRAPLRAMDGFSRILLEDYAATLDPEAQRYLQLVRDSAQQMGQLIDALLMLSHLGRRQMERRRVAPAEVVALALEDLEGERDGRVVELQVHDLQPCNADPALLRQVYVNLLSNALKFTRYRDEARIDVGWGRLERDGQTVGAYWVRDNGAGFDMRYVDKLFGVFQRLHRAENFPGTGAGLAIVRRIVQRHGGAVWAEGQVDAGATFFFTIGADNDQ
jgi:PAS domain S-box-containing protein